MKRCGLGPVAGVDEAGRGPLFGPVLAAAFIPREIGLPENVNDSKQLSEREREAIYPSVIDAAADFAVGLATAAEIDRLNILVATKLAMKRALRGLRLKPALVLVDGLCLDGPIPSRKIIRGDATVGSIAAASIIAKVTRDALMRGLHRRFPGYHLDRNKGYGTPEHLEALRRLGPTALHRKTFNGVRQPKLVL
ncbi:MAG TPA: ribonuclease HII [Acidobacteriota bacterium]|nr:ribonuclease HII [Acidobacteriota bacterium]